PRFLLCKMLCRLLCRVSVACMHNKLAPGCRVGRRRQTPHNWRVGDGGSKQINFLPGNNSGNFVPDGAGEPTRWLGSEGGGRAPLLVGENSPNEEFNEETTLSGRTPLRFGKFTKTGG